MKLLVFLSVLFISNVQAMSLRPLIITGPAANELYSRGFVEGKSRAINCTILNGDIECTLRAFVKTQLPESGPRMCTMQFLVMYNPTTGECANGSNGCVINDLKSIGYRGAQDGECGL